MGYEILAFLLFLTIITPIRGINELRNRNKTPGIIFLILGVLSITNLVLMIMKNAPVIWLGVILWCSFFVVAAIMHCIGKKGWGGNLNKQRYQQGDNIAPKTHQITSTHNKSQSVSSSSKATVVSKPLETEQQNRSIKSPQGESVNKNMYVVMYSQIFEARAQNNNTFSLYLCNELMLNIGIVHGSAINNGQYVLAVINESYGIWAGKVPKGVCNAYKFLPVKNDMRPFVTPPIMGIIDINSLEAKKLISEINK
ncbi:MAG: hypothetical protein FWD49_02485 [Firmicutes bacterium]|nr:hypothetical protein [Bacillota bacterium]